jgi:hypothetical protein
MMNRSTPAIVLLLASCARAPAPPLFPPSIAGSWKLTESAAQPAANAPEPVRRLGLKRVERASYEGQGAITADVYELASSAAGLELAQTWRPAADTVFFYKDTYFAVVKWKNAEKTAVTAFVRDLEKHLGALR